MRRSALGPFLLAALVAAPVLPAQVVTTVKGTTIRARYVAGQKTMYRLVTETTFFDADGKPGAPLRSEARVSEEVLSADGTLAILRRVTSSGRDEEPSVETLRIGKGAKSTAESARVPVVPAMTTFPGELPPRPLKIGETWTVEQATPDLTHPDGKTRSQYTFLGLVNLAGRRVARLEFAMAMSGSPAMTGSGRVDLDPADARIVASFFQCRLTIPAPRTGEPMTVGIATETTRL